jgi:glutaredoxin-related protein
MRPVFSYALTFWLRSEELMSSGRQNGTELSAQEFRDALLVRYTRCPPDLPIQCGGCQQKFSVCHALECKRGGLVISRHNEIRDELSDLASKALYPQQFVMNQ